MTGSGRPTTTPARAQREQGDDAFAVIGRAALAAGCGRRGTVGEADRHLAEARPLVDFGAAWITEPFGSRSDRAR